MRRVTPQQRRMRGGRDSAVVVMPSLARNADLQRAMAVSRRIVLERTGVSPGVSGEEVGREAAIAAALREVDASLLVLPLGEAPEARAAAVSIGRHVTCPLLVVPSSSPYSTGRREPHRYDNASATIDPGIAHRPSPRPGGF